MPDVGIADGHRSCGIAMIGPGEGQKLLSRAHALVQPELHRHLHGDLDGDRAGVGEEYAGQIARHAGCEPSGQRERLLVGEPAEHDVRHQRKLSLDRFPDVGMVIAVAGRPPGCDPIDEFASVGEHDAAALGTDHRQGRACRLHLRVRQPDMGDPGLIPRRSLACSRAGLLARHSALPFEVHCRHSALANRQGRCEDAFTR